MSACTRGDRITTLTSRARPTCSARLAGYFGLVSFLDEQIGKILGVLSETGLADTTRVIYTSDHGDNLGARGLWGKATMYEESAGIPMLMAGDGVPAGAVCRTPVTLCDVTATILDAVGASDAIGELGLPGVSLLRPRQPAAERPDRAVGISHLRPRRLLHAARAAP